VSDGQAAVLCADHRDVPGQALAGRRTASAPGVTDTPPGCAAATATPRDLDLWNRKG